MLALLKAPLPPTVVLTTRALQGVMHCACIGADWLVCIASRHAITSFVPATQRSAMICHSPHVHAP